MIYTWCGEICYSKMTIYMGENIILKAITSLHHWNFLKTIELYDLCWFGQAHTILFHETPKYKAPIRIFSMARW